MIDRFAELNRNYWHDRRGYGNHECSTPPTRCGVVVCILCNGHNQHPDRCIRPLYCVGELQWKLRIMIIYGTNGTNTPDLFTYS